MRGRGWGLFEGEETGKGFDGGSRWVTAGDPAGDDPEPVGRTIRLKIDVADELVPGEEREGIIAALAFRGGGVDFPSVVETPKASNERPVDDEGIEGGDQTGVRRGRDGLFEQREVGTQAVDGPKVVDGEGLNFVRDGGKFGAF